MTTPRIAQIGVGAWGRNHLRNWHALGALKLVCDLDEGRLEEAVADLPGVRHTPSADAVLDDPDIDAVVIATPAATHFQLAQRALEQGKDVFVEKPLSLKVAEGETLVRTARTGDRILMVGHVLVYHAAVRRLQELVAQGALGRIQYIYSNRLNLGRIRTEENSLWSFAPHDVALTLGILGTLPDTVACHGGDYLSQDVADVTLTTLTFPGTVRAHIFVSWLHPFKEQRFVVVGTQQMAVFDDTREWPEKLMLYPHRVDWLDGQVPVAHKAEATPVALEPAEPLQSECAHFLSCVADRTRPQTDGVSALRTLRVLAAAQRSLDLGGAPIHELSTPVAPPTRATIHPTATVDEDVSIGEQTHVWHYSHIMTGARIGAGCNLGQNVFVGRGVHIGDRVKIQNNVSVYEGVTLGDEVFCGPSMVFTNVVNPRSGIEKKDQFQKTRIRRGATLGANCTIVCGTTVGRYALVGAGAVVTSDVPDHALVWGVPARQSGWVCVCGETLNLTRAEATCPACQRSYELLDDSTLRRLDG